MVNKFWTFAPAFIIQLIDFPSSTKVNTSIFSKQLCSEAQEVIFFTASNSPSDTLAEATSKRSTSNSSKSNFAIVNFSETENDTPDVCSPSRSVVSIISIFLFAIVKP